MQMPMKATVIQASRYDMDGNKGGSIICTNKPSEQMPNRAGLDVMKMTAPYEIVDQLKDYAPCECDLVVEPVQGAGGKMSFKLLKITPVVKKTA
jgi:hypothetical protein